MQIRTYHGDGEDVARLLQHVWSEAYQSRAWFPLWSGEFLRWQLADDRRFAVAAYDNDTVAGSFFGVPHTLRIGSATFPITLSSWYTIDPKYRSPRLGLDLIEALRRRHEEEGHVLSLGVVKADRTSTAYRFWSRYAQVMPRNLRFLTTFGYWFKMLDHRAVLRAGLKPWERGLARMAGAALSPTPWRWSDAVRAYRPDDLEACCHLLARATAGFEWSLTWKAEQLRHQLEGPVPRTWVLELSGEVRGFVNYHHVQLQGRVPLRLAFVDLWAGPDLGPLQVQRLFGSVCAEIRRDGTEAVVCVRSSLFPSGALLANGFAPLPPDSHRVALFTRPDIPLTLPRTWNLLAR